MVDDTQGGTGPFDAGGETPAMPDVFDPFSTGVFGDEIAGIDESDWDIDGALIWGEDAVDGLDADEGAGPGAEDFFA